MLTASTAAALALAIPMGALLSLLGGGGSLLAVPILVYLLHIPPMEATAYSLVVVGLSAALAVHTHHKHGAVAYKAGLWFALPSLLTVYAARHTLLPSLPAALINTPTITLTKETALMLLFGLLMLLVAKHMLTGQRSSTTAPLLDSLQAPCGTAASCAITAAEGAGVGLLTGLLGAGGGFIIVPALHHRLKLPMKRAIGTSLFVIALNSAAGLAGSIPIFQQAFATAHSSTTGIPLLLLLGTFLLLTLIGTLIGGKLTPHISSDGIRKLFGILTLILGASILLQQLTTIVS